MLRALIGRSLAVALLSASIAAPGQAQARWTAEKRSSLAWWQVNPHMNHLWATTCPEEPSWRPGEGRSGGWSISQVFTPAKQGDAAVSDTTIIPLYPRRKVRAVCTEAVTAEIIAIDTVTWRGLQGKIVVDAAKLVGGSDQRDQYARKAILETSRYPEITFVIDSLVKTSRKADTLIGTAWGQFTVHGVTQPVSSAIKAWRDAGGVRVTSRFHTRARDLIEIYKISQFALGLGVAANVWKEVWMGVDMVLVPEGARGT